MAFSQADLDALDAAIASGRGVRSMTFSDQSVTFNSIEDMLRLRSVMRQELDATSSTPKTHRFAVTSKGA